MTGVVIDLVERLRRPLRIRVQASRPGPLPTLAWGDAGLEVVHYERAAIHEGVPLVQLVSALNRAGFTVSNLTHCGLVIHRMGQNPERPSEPFNLEDHPA